MPIRVYVETVLMLTNQLFEVSSGHRLSKNLERSSLGEITNTEESLNFTRVNVLIDDCGARGMDTFYPFCRYFWHQLNPSSETTGTLSRPMINGKRYSRSTHYLKDLLTPSLVQYPHQRMVLPQDYSCLYAPVRKVHTLS